MAKKGRAFVEVTCATIAVHHAGAFRLEEDGYRYEPSGENHEVAAIARALERWNRRRRRGRS